MRTQQEIVEKINSLSDYIFDFERQDLLVRLDYENAKPFLKPETTQEIWDKARSKILPVREQMIDYMPFAWEKANDKRGISAYRSICHYSAWLWLEGNDSLSEEIGDYEFYGKPQLIKICEYLGLDPNQWDDGIRENS